MKAVVILGEGYLFNYLRRETKSKAHDVFICENKNRDEFIEEYKEKLKGSFFIDISDFLDFKKQEEMLVKIKELKAQYLPFSVNVDKLIIGPLANYEKKVACSICLLNKIKDNRENSAFWFGENKVFNNNIIKKAFFSISRSILDDEIQRFKEENISEFNEKYIIVDNRDLATREGSVIPHEDCPICSFVKKDSKKDAYINLKDRIKKSPRSYRLNDVDLPRLKRELINRESGLIRHIYWDLNSNMMPMIGAEINLVGDQREKGFGRDFSYINSEKSAILEAIERYVSAAPRIKESEYYGSYNDLRDKAIDPRKFGLHDEKQMNEKSFKLKKYSDDMEFSWIWAYSFKEDKPVLIPEQVIYYSLEGKKHSKPVNRFVYESSNGCALGSTLEEAIFYGLLEVIERDSFLVSWYNKLPLTEIDLDDVEDEEILILRDKVLSKGYELHFYDMTMESGVPSIWGMIINNNKDVKFNHYNAAGAHIDPEKALKGALVEIVSSMPIYESLDVDYKTKSEEMLIDSSKVIEMHDHIILYSNKKAFSRLNFVNDGSKRVGMKKLYSDWYNKEQPINLTEELKYLIAKILKEHDDIYVVQFEHPLLDRYSLNAVKVVIPTMLTVTFGHQYRRIVQSRVLDAPILAGRKDSPIKVEAINEDPHPFP